MHGIKKNCHMFMCTGIAHYTYVCLFHSINTSTDGKSVQYGDKIKAKILIAYLMLQVEMMRIELSKLYKYV